MRAGFVALIEIALESFAQGREVREAQLLGQGVIRLRRLWRAHRLHGHLKDRGFAAKGLRLIGFGERHRDVEGLFGRGPQELLLEAGDELAGAQDELGVFRRASREGLAGDAADEIDHHLISVLSGDLLSRASLIGPIFRRDLGQLLVDLRLGRAIDRALQ